jgi:hypothetical protein
MRIKRFAGNVGQWLLGILGQQIGFQVYVSTHGQAAQRGHREGMGNEGHAKAIGLDVDSGNRRRALLEARVSLGVGGVLVSGTF